MCNIKKPQKPVCVYISKIFYTRKTNLFEFTQVKAGVNKKWVMKINAHKNAPTRDLEHNTAFFTEDGMKIACVCGQWSV